MLFEDAHLRRTPGAGIKEGGLEGRQVLWRVVFPVRST